MEYIISTMIQVFRENQNKPMMEKEIIDYYFYHKGIQVEPIATAHQLKQAIKALHKNGTIKQSNSNLPDYGKKVTYTYVVETPNTQLSLL